MLLNLPIHVGGYAALLYVPIIGLLYKKNEYFILGLILSTVFCSFWDILQFMDFDPERIIVYLSGEEVVYNPELTFGTVIRPISNFLTLAYLFRKIKKNVNDKII